MKKPEIDFPDKEFKYLSGNYGHLWHIFECGLEEDYILNLHPYQKELWEKMDKEFREGCIWTVRQG